MNTRTCLILVIASLSPMPTFGQWTTESLPFHQRFDYAAAATATHLYVGGGHDTTGLTTTHVDILDLQSRQWSTAQLSEPRTDLCAVAVDGKVFFAGGVLQSFVASDRVDIFDEASGTWSQTSLPVPASAIGVGAAGGKVVFAGGTWTGLAPGVAQVYDIASGQWTVEPLLGPRLGIPTASDGRWVCLVGGDVGPGNPPNSLSVYDSITDTWRHGTMSHPVTGAAIVGDRLFAHVCPPPSTQIEVLDLTTGDWSRIDLPVARCSAFVGAAEPYVVFANGFLPGPTILESADVYNTISGTWSTMPVTGRVSRAAAEHRSSNSFFVIGGSFPTSTGATDVIDIFSADPAPGSPYCTPALPNSTGTPASIGAVGSTAAFDSFFTLIADGTPAGQFGYFLAGQTQGTLNPPGSEGILCLSGNIARFNAPTQIIQGPGGAIDIDLTAIPVTPTQAVQPGDTWNFQCWYRDNNPGVTSNFTDAISVVFD
ncbi:MAG: hypothetical protein GY722_15435 [bacterium]|nr:hypothetical protein [bacterium]